MKNPSDSDAELLGAFDQALLSSAKADEPPAGAAVRAAAALSGAVVTAAGAAGAMSGVAAKSSFLALVTKPFVIGVLGGVVVGGGVFLLRSELPGPASRAKVPALPSAAPGPVKSSSALSNGSGPTPTSSQAPAEVTARPAHRRDAEPESAVVPPLPEAARATLGSEASFPPLPSASAAASGPSSIAAEIRSVDAAREALRSGRPEAALAEIARYRQRVPRGMLATEVSLLEIQAELALGHRELARGKARAFLAEHPGDSYRARVQALFPAGERP
jgi:hypothetical protein